MRIRLFLVAVGIWCFSNAALAEGEPPCPAAEQPIEAAKLQMPVPRGTGEMHNPQESDVVVEFVVDAAGVVFEAKVVHSETWSSRTAGPSRPHYFDQASLEQVLSRKYAPRSESCRGDATFKFRFNK